MLGNYLEMNTGIMFIRKTCHVIIIISAIINTYVRTIMYTLLKSSYLVFT